MGFHVVVFQGNQTNGSALIKLAALGDTNSNIQNSNLVVGKMSKLIGAHAYGAHQTRAQLQAPALQKPGYPDIMPAFVTLPGALIKPHWGRYLDNPLDLVSTEQLSVFAINGGSGAEHDWAAILLSDAVPAAKHGRSFWMKLTGTTTLTAYAQTAVPLTFEDNLPAGKYSCIGARAQSAGAIYFRLYSPDFGYRPGGIAVQSIDYPAPDIQEDGTLGEWFTFDNTVNINADFYSVSADTAETVFLHLIGPG